MREACKEHTTSYWHVPALVHSLHERFPRLFQIEFGEVTTDAGIRVTMTRNGNSVGDALSDNALDDDGYRFHDVFHLSYAAVLGWSPIMRKLLKIKRKSDAETDDVEDGARARIIEELVSQLVFTYARAHNFLDGVNRLDYHLLKTIQSLIAKSEFGRSLNGKWPFFRDTRCGDASGAITEA